MKACSAYQSIIVDNCIRAVRTYKSHEMNKPLRLAIPFRVPRDGVLEDGLSLAYEPVPVKSSVVPSGLCSTECEGNPGEIFAALGFLDGIEFPIEKK